MQASIFVTLLLAGALLLALWTDLRIGGGPARVLVVLPHLGASVLALVLSTQAMAAVDGSRPLAVLSVMAVFLPALVYLFVSTIWALRLVQRSVVR